MSTLIIIMILLCFFFVVSHQLVCNLTSSLILLYQIRLTNKRIGLGGHKRAVLRCVSS
ncbi:unnamed protein product [Brassica rapa subsp. narinosa]